MPPIRGKALPESGRHDVGAQPGGSHTGRHLADLGVVQGRGAEYSNGALMSLKRIPAMDCLPYVAQYPCHAKGYHYGV